MCGLKYRLRAQGSGLRAHGSGRMVPLPGGVRGGFNMGLAWYSEIGLRTSTSELSIS